ncbi:hypothetical protein TNCV_4798701 [Trichonephila clavipes]|nr:hypothetical protein TNCV_4798701 [Trichonephila clavipes]
MWFQDDVAPAHFSADVRSALDTHIQGDGLDMVVRYMKSHVYASPIDSDDSLVARIAVVAGDIQEMPGVFADVRQFPPPAA